jgi:hypothetical protein
MIKTIIAIALLTSSCSVVKASNIAQDNSFKFDKDVVHNSSVISNKEMIFINQESDRKKKVDENIKTNVTFEKWKAIIKDRS